jgi:hypothetical protein
VRSSTATEEPDADPAPHLVENSALLAQ